MIVAVRRKLLAEDVTDELAKEAIQYLREVVSGEFQFLDSVREVLDRVGHISKAQIAGVLNCRAAKAAQIERTQTSERQDPVPDGTYTIVFADHSYVTLRLKPDWREGHENSQVAQFLSGPDNDTDYAGFAFVENRSFRIWSRFVEKKQQIEALKVLLQGDSWRSAGEAYALKANKCFKCGRTLTVPVSLHRGLGPVCAERV